MQITIHKKKFSFLDKYEVYDNGALIYFAETALQDLLLVIKLCEPDSHRPKMIIHYDSGLLHSSYTITRWDNNVLEFKGTSFICYCNCGGDEYVLYEHKGRKYSIYKNDIQVGWWDRDEKSVFGGREYLLIADKDADVPLLVSFCLIIDDVHTRSFGGSAIEIDLGHFGDEGKPFNESWQPKE